MSTPKKVEHFDVHSRADLIKSLDDWKAKLAKEHNKLTRLQKVEAALHRQMQVAHARIALRRKEIRNLQGGRGKAVRNALHYVGTTEHPAGSNTGPRVDHWEGLWGIYAQPWCGAFAGAMCKNAGAHLTSRVVYTPYIYQDAAGHVNGMDKVEWSRHGGGHGGKAGDLVLFDFGTGSIEHVGILVKDWDGRSALETVEGNTSFSNGSQSNGGCVARKSRDKSLVYAVVSVKW